VKITKEESEEIVLEAVKPMGDEYCSIIKKALNEN
jgi:oligoendopeptidase F